MEIRKRKLRDGRDYVEWKKEIRWDWIRENDEFGSRMFSLVCDAILTWQKVPT